MELLDVGRSRPPPPLQLRFCSAAALFFFLLASCLVGGANGGVLFSSLPRTLIVTASPLPGQVLKAGEDTITVKWVLNHSSAAAAPGGGAAAYESVKVKLCYAPASQDQRTWRKTNDDLHKDKTCQFDIVTQSFSSSSSKGGGGSFVYVVARNVPTATYFVRAYALDAAGTQVAYGQTTDANKSTNLFKVVGISGRHASIDIAAGCFSAMSLLLLVALLVNEKRKAT